MKNYVTLRLLLIWFIKKLNKLKMNRAPGVDFVGTKMLVELSEVISEVVAILFNKSLTTAEILNDWKLENVTSVFKKVANLAQ